MKDIKAEIFGQVRGAEEIGEGRKLVSCTFLIAYSRAKLNSSGDKAYPCFKPFSIGKLEDK